PMAKTVGRIVVKDKPQVSRTPGSVHINTKASNIVVDPATDRGKWNAMYWLPGDTICRGRHSEIIAISMTILLKTTIYPNKVDFARAVNASTKKDVATIVRILGERRYPCNGYRTAPT